MIFDLCIICFVLLEFLFQPVQREVEFIVAVEVEVIAHTAAIGGDGLLVGDAVETEQLLHTSEIGVGKTDIGKFLFHFPLQIYHFLPISARKSFHIR
ncbi:MAG: hypothetical protein Q4E58_08975 [Prevotellaceae bacterium]|nr:hypothetical protein [Prevotellaceae bacterium]